MSPHLRVAAAVCLVIASVATPALAQPWQRPDLRATRAATPPIIDGALDDEAWQVPPMETGEWLSYNPLNGDRIPQATTVWVAYDADYLYFAFKCDDPDPAGIKTSVTRRDNIWNDDWVGVSLDALGSGQLSYHMMVNPSGVQLDLLNSAAGGEDGAPDWIWDSAGRLSETGYSVELRLPLQSIRFRGGSNVRMGILFFRRVSRLGVSVSWPPLPPGQWVFERHASVYFDDLQSRRTRELLPSVTFARRQERESPSRWHRADQKTDAGFSAKVGLTPTVTLDATVNPDFSQVESDAFQVEVNRRFPIFFDEKRPFFMEGTGIFALANGGPGENALRTAVHTRRIVDPIFGTKLTGSVGRITFGELSAVDEADDHDRFFHIGRAQYSLGPSNYIGALFTSVSSSIDSNRVIGSDLKWRLTPTQRIEGFALLSNSHHNEGAGGSPNGAGGQVSYSLETQKWLVITAAEHYDRAFEMETAFINRVGVTNASGFVGYSFYPEKTKYPWLRRVMLLSYAKYGEDRVEDGRERMVLGGGQFHFSRQGFFRVQRFVGYEPWTGRRFDRVGTNAYGFVQLFRWLSVNGGVSGERAIYYDRFDPFQGIAHDSNIGVTLQPSGRLSEDVGVQHVTFDRESTGARVYTVSIVNTKTRYQFTRALGLRGIAQYDSSRRRVLTDYLGSYEPRPGTVVYVGYGSLIEQRAFADGGWVPLTGAYRTTERGFFFKASYLYRF